MDARTYIDTKVTGYELAAKRQAAAKARQAKVSRQRSIPQASNEPRGARLARIWNVTGGSAMWQKVKGAVIGIFLAALVVGAVGAHAPRTAVSAGTYVQQVAVRTITGSHQLIARRGLPRHTLGVPGGSHQYRLALYGRGPAHWMAVRTRAAAANI